MINANPRLFAFNSDDVLATWRDVHRRLRQPEIDRLIAFGVPPIAIVRDPLPYDGEPLTAARIQFINDGFEFAGLLRDADAAETAIIIPARDINGGIIDMGAWSPATGRFAFWLNRLPMLGENNVLSPRFEPLRVHPTVLDWLKDNRMGVFIADAKRASYSLEGFELLAPSVAFGGHLRKALARPAPPIFIDQAARRVA